MHKIFLDATQYAAYRTCPLMWWEKYVHGIQPSWGEGQRDDALAIGSLMHDGLEHRYTENKIAISESLIESIGPTPEALNLVKSALAEHMRVYCDDEFSVEFVERTVVMPQGTHKVGALDVELCFTSKLDTIALHERGANVNGGTESRIPITAGAFVLEAKTKGAEISRAMYRRKWMVNKQAVFETMALRHLYGESVANPAVIIDVTEKPRRYIPTRKCKAVGGCGRKIKFAEWIEDVKDGHYRCPLCGTVQPLTPPDTNKDNDPTPTMYRFGLSLAPEYLAASQFSMLEVAKEMAEIKFGSHIPAMHEDKCVDVFGRWNCAFFEHHVAGREAAPDGKLIEIANPTEYMGLET